MKKLLTRNLGLKLASLLLAFVLWFLVAQIYDPKDTVTFNNIQVRLINTELLDEEGKVYEVLDNSNLVRVTVTGPQSIVKSELRRSDIVAEADMSKLTDINTIAITYYCENISNDSVEIKGNHDSVRLNVEDKTSKWIKLESNTIGDVASGYMIGNVTLDQTNIEVTGPKSAISQVDHAGVDINVTDSTTSLSANVDIKLYDADDNELVLESVRIYDGRSTGNEGSSSRNRIHGCTRGWLYGYRRGGEQRTHSQDRGNRIHTGGNFSDYRAGGPYEYYGTV